MVEQEMRVDKLGVQSNYHPYPSPLSTYEDVVTSPEIFMDTLKKFHFSMGTKFIMVLIKNCFAVHKIGDKWIPIVGGRDLDLHRLFVEVTSRGGVTKVLKEKRWKEVTSVFSFPSSATNASFIIRKYYISLLYHYEQSYLFKAKCWTPSPADTMQHLSTVTATPGSSQYATSATQQQQFHAPANSIATSVLEEPKAPSAGSPVCGVIDGKFDSGYLITVKIGSEEFKGVLYQVPGNETQTVPNNNNNYQGQDNSAFVNLSSVKPGVTRRKRRKKSEIRKRDPAHPKPNRSGYNFFFAEQHARLKPLYHGKDREISRIIGESWRKLKEPEIAVYQEKAIKDKERYKIEMEDYRERLRTGQIVRGATIPTHHYLPVPETNLTDLNTTYHFETANSAYADDNEMTDKSISSEEYESANKGSDFDECLQPDAKLKNVNIELMDDDMVFDLQMRPDQNDENNNALAEDGISVPIEEMEQQPLGNNNGNEPFLGL